MLTVPRVNEADPDRPVRTSRKAEASTLSSNRLVLAEAVGLGVSAPLLLFPSPYSIIALALLTTLWAYRLVASSNDLRSTPAALPLGGLTLMACVSLYPSVDLILSLPKLYGLILGLYVLRLAVQHAGTANRRSWLANLLLASGVAISLLALVGVEWQVSKLPWLAPVYAWLPHLITNVRTSLSTQQGIHPNEVGGVLSLLLPLAAGLALFADTWRMRALPLVAAAVMAGTLGLTLSRSAIGGVLVALTLLLMLRWPRLWLGLPVVIVLAGAALVRFGLDPLAQAFAELDASSGGAGIGRLEVWSRALAMVRDFPLTGVGLNTFPVVLRTLYPLASIDPSANNLPHAHNLFLQTAVDFGIVGLMCFVGLWIVAGAGLIRRWRKAIAERALVAAAGAGLLAHLLYSQTDAVALGAKAGVVLWAVMGLALALGYDGRGPGGKVVVWGYWVLFTTACGLGGIIAISGARTLPL